MRLVKFTGVERNSPTRTCVIPITALIKAHITSRTTRRKAEAVG
jgi:hypothetical protein